METGLGAQSGHAFISALQSLLQLFDARICGDFSALIPFACLLNDLKIS
jgi:hypothetical protein